MRLKCIITGSQHEAQRAQERQIHILLPSVDKESAVLAPEGSSKSSLTEWAPRAKGTLGQRLPVGLCSYLIPEKYNIQLITHSYNKFINVYFWDLSSQKLNKPFYKVIWLQIRWLKPLVCG